MMLVVAGPDDLTADRLEEALAPVAGELDLVMAVRAIDDDVPTSPVGDDWVVSVYGADRPGIVHRVTRLLAEQGVNVVDLSTKVIGEPETPVYAMVLEVTLPKGTEPSDLERDLGQLAEELGVECSLHPDEADIL
jgi:glycine cleavage system transcriptional repressor